MCVHYCTYVCHLSVYAYVSQQMQLPSAEVEPIAKCSSHQNIFLRHARTDVAAFAMMLAHDTDCLDKVHAAIRQKAEQWHHDGCFSSLI